MKSTTETQIVPESIEAQTESDDIIFCYEFDFPADYYNELGEHMIVFHAET